MLHALVLLISALASINKLNRVSKSLWSEGNEIVKVKVNSQSNVQLESIDKLSPLIEEELFNSQIRFLVSTSFVINENALCLAYSYIYKWRTLH